jgi:hypothetical protein
MWFCDLNWKRQAPKAAKGFMGLSLGFSVDNIHVRVRVIFMLQSFYFPSSSHV